MKFASSVTLFLAAALTTLSAAQEPIFQASAKPMIVKPGGLVSVSVQMVSDDMRRRLEGGEKYEYIEVSGARLSTLSTTLYSHHKLTASSAPFP
jgi:hypothetical protein